MYDLVVIGSGPAGEKGAAQAAYFGRRVAIVEREPVPGGACVNTGTVPSKTLRESALHLSGFRQRGFRGAVDDMMKNDVTVTDLMYRKQIVVENEWKQINENLERHKVDRYRGTARLLSTDRVEVRHEGRATILDTDIILIATGSSPYRPPDVPFDDDSICDSDTILKIHDIPRTMAVVGAGVIGCEYASIFGALGVQVHLIDGRTSLLPHVDREIVDVLVSEMQNRLNVKMHLGCDVEKISREGHHEVTVRLKNGSVLQVETLLYAAGRVSNTADLNLESAGVQTGARGLLTVNDKYQTTAKNIYAAGDVIGFPALASTSMEQARVAMVHAFDLKYKTSVAATLPYGIYTIPEVAMIGLTEDFCRQKGQAFAVGRAYFRNNARGQIIGDDSGMIKLVFEPGDLRLMGVHIIGENASELLHIGMTVMQFSGTINAFIDSVFNFPTLGEAYKYAAYDGLGNVARRQIRREARLRAKELT